MLKLIGLSLVYTYQAQLCGQPQLLIKYLKLIFDEGGNLIFNNF